VRLGAHIHERGNGGLREHCDQLGNRAVAVPDGPERQRLGAFATPDSATPGATVATIAARIFSEILLVIILGEVELGRIEDLGGDRRKHRPVAQFLLITFERSARRLFLRFAL